jgi:cell division protein FtsN
MKALNITFKRCFLATFFAALAINVYAGGGNEPLITVKTPSQNARLVLLDWSPVKSPEKGRFGLYRVERETNTYVLMKEIFPVDRYVLDENLALPLDNYFYRIESAPAGRELPQTKPIRIPEKEMIEQIASSYFLDPNALSGLDLEPLPDPIDSRFNQAPPYDQAFASQVKPTRTGTKLNDGIYIGALSFTGKVTDLTQNFDGSNTLIPLDPSGRQELLEHLFVGYVPSHAFGTALYYAEHQALANLTELDKAGLLPPKVDSVTFITFTDGIDTSSTDAALTPIEGRDFRHSPSATTYRNYIQQQLSNRRIAGKNINAWSIGIRGRDVVNENEFGQTLRALSSNGGRVSELDDLSDIESDLMEIADGLNIYTPQVNLTFSTPAYPVGTIIRITFDNWISSPEGAEYYVDARLGWGEGGYTLSGLTARGVALADTKTVVGTRNGSAVEYTIKIKNDFALPNVKQWYRQSNEGMYGWQANSEFVAHKATAFIHERKTAIVYLVLDGSSSLHAEEITKVRSAINMFVDRLYNAASRQINLPQVGVEEDYNYSGDNGGNGGFYPNTQNSGSLAQSPPTTYRPPQQPRSKSSANSSSNPPTNSLTITSNNPSPAYSYIDNNYADRSGSQPSSSQARQPGYREPDYNTYQTYQTYQPAPQQRTTIAATPAQQPAPVYVSPGYSAPSAPRNQSRPSQSAQYSANGNLFWIQVGSYSEVAYAQKAWRVVSGYGFADAQIFEKKLNGGIYYRVKLGPYSDRDAAEYALNVLKNCSPEYYDSFIAAE